MNTSRSNNGFDALRLLAASLVIFDHSYLRGGRHHHLLAEFGFSDVGLAAVSVFFAISGYLVTQSWLADPSLPRFLARRFLRIFPAMAAVVMVSVFVLGPLLTEKPIHEYFGDPQTWAYLKNIALYEQPKTLPGVFAHNPDTALFNGPLWTLPYEVLCYGIVAVAGSLGLYRVPMGNLALALAGLAYVLVNGHGIAITETTRYIPCMLAFMTGSVMASEKVFCASFRALPVLCAVAAITVYMTRFDYVGSMLLAIAAIAAARRVAVSVGKNDYSYGLYLWGYIVEQILAGFCRSLDDYSFVLLSLCLAAFPAMLSWRLIEVNALRLKPRRPPEMPEKAA